LLKQQNTNDPAEKSRIQAQIAIIDKNIAGFQKRLDGLTNQKKNNEETIDKVYDKFDDNLTQEQFIQQSSSIN
jgi:predicted  nucleic acid-binding Zn-ribbon protein